MLIHSLYIFSLSPSEVIFFGSFIATAWGFPLCDQHAADVFYLYGYICFLSPTQTSRKRQITFFHFRAGDRNTSNSAAVAIDFPNDCCRAFVRVCIFMCTRVMLALPQLFHPHRAALWDQCDSKPDTGSRQEWAWIIQRVSGWRAPAKWPTPRSRLQGRPWCLSPGWYK